MRFRLKPYPTEPEKWFAWFPVVARKKVPAGFIYCRVWLESVSRTRVTAMGLAQWLYEI